MGSANLAPFDNFVEVTEVAVEAAVKADLKLHATSFHGSQGTVNFGQIEGDGFFAENMFPCLGRLDNQPGMGVGAGTDNNSVDRGVIEKNAVIRMRGRNGKIGGTLMGVFDKNIGNTDNLRVGNTIDTFGVDATNAARTDEA